MIIKKTLIAAASLTILGLGVLTVPAHATGPEFTIQYEVRDLTIGTDFVDADDPETALHAAPGDTLEYRATIQNNSAPDPNGSDNLTLFVVYPNGTKIWDDTADSGSNMVTLNESVAPGKPITHLWQTTITSTTEDDSLLAVIGIACDPAVCPYLYNDQDQNNSWNAAYVTVDSHAADTPASDPTPDTTATNTDDTPETPTDETPIVTTDTTEETPQTPATPEVPAKMPNTGSSASVTAVVAVLATVGGYTLNTLRLRRSVR